MILREKDRGTLTAIFARSDAPIEVLAFGSRVKGTAHDASNLDLVIRTADRQPLPANVFNRIVGLIKDSTIPILIDIFDWSNLPENFQEQIEQQHEVLFTNIGE